MQEEPEAHWGCKWLRGASQGAVGGEGPERPLGGEGSFGS